MGEMSPWHWRQAMQFGAQMPPEEHDCWVVLECLTELVRMSFTRPPDQPVQADDCQLVRFPGSSPSRRAVPVARLLSYQNKANRAITRQIVEQ